MNEYVILGGGIAGLACAIQLKKSGKQVIIFEKNPKNHPFGHAFILMPNGLRSLEKLGIQKEIAEKAHPIHQFKFQNNTGTLINCQTLKGAVGIRREVLLTALRNELTSKCIQYQKSVNAIKWNPQNASKQINFEDGTKITGKYIIGADGIWSKTRQAVVGRSKLSTVRIREIVSVIKSPELVQEFKGTFLKTIHKDGGLAVGMLPCDEEHLVWFIQYDSHDHRLLEITIEEQKERLFHLIRTWCHPMSALVSQTNLDQSYTWHTTDLEPIAQYHKDNIVLLGDAAHVLLTLTSQGVSSALEDAITLTDLIQQQSNNDMSAIFSQYSSIRKPIMDGHFQSCLLYTSPSPRDATLSRMPSSA